VFVVANQLKGTAEGTCSNKIFRAIGGQIYGSTVGGILGIHLEAGWSGEGGDSNTVMKFVNTVAIGIEAGLEIENTVFALAGGRPHGSKE